MEKSRKGNLPEELVHEILLRLPVKTLLICKCVCKEWYALIKSTSFINRHFSRESNPEWLVFQLLGDDWNECEFSFYQDDERHSLVEEPNHLRQMRAVDIFLGPEKGILCVVNVDNHNRIVLWNPAMNEFKTLPPHPLQSRAVIGFGLDPSSGDLKVVAFEHSDSEGQNSAYVYNLSSDSWKRIEIIDLLDKIVFCRRMEVPVSNGVAYWLAKLKSGGVPSILAFDMKSEKFQEILIPDALRLRHTKGKFRITAYGHSLALLAYKNDEHVDIWVMGGDGLWIKSFRTGPFDYVKPLFVWKKKKLFLKIPLSSTLIICDISTQKVTTLVPEAEDLETEEPYVCDHFIYKESLVSIEGSERADWLQGFLTTQSDSDE